MWKAERDTMSYVVESRPSLEFNYDAAITRLMRTLATIPSISQVELLVPGDEDPHSRSDELSLSDTRRQDIFLKLSACIDVNSRISVGCAGAVLTYIRRRRSAEDLYSNGDTISAFRVSSICTFTLKDMMYVAAIWPRSSSTSADIYRCVNSESMASLQIIHSEVAPNLHSQGPKTSSSGSKEGLSIYGLFRPFANSPQGKHLLKQVFLRPTLDIRIINERLDAINVFLRSDNIGLVQSMSRSLKSIKNMRTVMIHLRKGVNRGSGSGAIHCGVWSTLRSV